MKKVIVFYFLFFSTFYLAQDQKNVTSGISEDSLLSVARTLIDSAGSKVLVTVDQDGIPHARQMDPFAPDENFTIWFATNPDTRKVKQIKNNPNVAVFYYDPDSHGYVSINGVAELINDSAAKEKYWKGYWKRYYTNPEKDMILIKVEPERMELISYRHGVFWKDSTFMPQYLEFKNQK